MNRLEFLNHLYCVVNPSTYHSNESSIYDIAASGQYLKAEAPHDLTSRTVAPIQVKQPNGPILHSTKGCQIKLAALPEEAREVHILPRLAHISLIYIGELCNSRFEDSFNHHNMAVTKYEQVILQGTRDVLTGLWRFPLHSLDIPTNQSNHVHQVNGKENSIKY